jgi:hypothetical protein
MSESSEIEWAQDALSLGMQECKKEWVLLSGVLQSGNKLNFNSP